MKTSFAVTYYLHSNPETVVLGVTSIVPNLNGILFFTEDGENYQIESYEMDLAKDLVALRTVIEYPSDEDIQDYFNNPEVVVVDHREH